MRIKSTLSAMVLLLAVRSYAQDPAPKCPPDADPQQEKMDSMALDSLRFFRGINAQFSKIIDPSSNTNIGNYAAVDIKDAAVTFGGSAQGSKGNIWAVKFSGGITDGVAAIWQNRELNKEVSAGLQWHLLGRKRSLRYFADSTRAARGGLRKLQQERKICFRDTVLRRKEVALVEEVAKRRVTLATAMTDSTKLWDDVLFPRHKRPPAEWKHDKFAGSDADALKYAKLVASIAFQRDTLAQRDAELARLAQSDACDRWMDCSDVFLAGFHKLATPLASTGATFGWVSLGMSYTSSKFKLYNDSVAYSDQVTKRTQGTIEGRIQWSYYHRDLYKLDHNYFFSVGLSAGITDNHKDLDELTLEERTPQLSPDSTLRTEISNYKVLEGSYHKDLATASLFVDAYYFLGRNSRSAVHLFPSCRIKEMEYPSIDLGIGFMVGFVQKDKIENAVNAEVYFNFPDLPNHNEADGNAWDRSDFGLRFSFPITFTQRP